MSKPIRDIEPFLRKVALWASSRGNLLAVALVGSHARGQSRGDSDIDLILLTETPNKYLMDRKWPAHFGAVVRTQTEPYGRITSLRVWYDDGREVEYGIGNRQWAEAPLDEGTRRVIRDGMRIVFERGTLLSRLLNPSPPP